MLDHQFHLLQTEYTVVSAHMGLDPDIHSVFPPAFGIPNAAGLNARQLLLTGLLRARLIILGAFWPGPQRLERLPIRTEPQPPR